MPGWSVTWSTPNVEADPDCKSFPFYAHRSIKVASVFRSERVAGVLALVLPTGPQTSLFHHLPTEWPTSRLKKKFVAFQE
mmetsp:Transcript_6881/g.24142  ORF Transcript_6881/g.24142 Transcript_6881/m.24142 type:complete len:80 (+) Transcript_6881:854-1093(+)